jgi:predicted DCC family thiol-disulfide oxidoreductase YuxK
MQAPEAPYFVWDGQCGFCGKWAGWLERRVRPGVPLIAFQDLDDLALAGLTEDDVQQASWWIPVQGSPRPGADGIAAALKAGAPWWTRIAGTLLAFPGIRSVARVAYGRIAANRHRLPAPDGPAPKRHPIEP